MNPRPLGYEPNDHAPTDKLPLFHLTTQVANKVAHDGVNNYEKLWTANKQNNYWANIPPLR